MKTPEIPAKSMNRSPRPKALARALPSLLLSLALVPFASAAVPSAINYQGRLTTAAGVPQPGPRAMSLKIFDAAADGTQLYAETLGDVAVDANGVYAFQFGAAGSSDLLVTETLATTDGTTTSYQTNLANPPALPGTLGVGDGTFSWHETTGNPGAPSTASATVMAGFVIGVTVTAGGSGYTAAPAVTITGNGAGTGATAAATVSDGSVTDITIISAGSGYTQGASIAIAGPPAPFIVNYAVNSVTITYAPAPPAGRAITATYRYSAPGISGALAAGAEQWLELTVDGTAQTPRQKILAVPFAMRAAYANDSTDFHARQSIQDTAIAVATASGTSFSEILARCNSTGNELGLIGSQGYNQFGITRVHFLEGRLVDRAVSFCTRPMVEYDGGFVKFGYVDGTDSAVGIPSWGSVTVNNPNPTKLVLFVETQQNGVDTSQGVTHYNHANLDVITTEHASITFRTAFTCDRFFPSPQALDSGELGEPSIVVRLSNSTTIVAEWNQWIDVPTGVAVASVEVRGRTGNTLRPKITGIKIIKI